MSEEENKNAELLKHASNCIAPMEKIHKNTSLLVAFNSLSLIIPALSILVPTAFKGHVSYSDSFLIATLASAASVQFSRWAKLKLKSQFDQIKNSVPPEHQKLAVGHTQECFKDKVSLDPLAISKDDFNLKDPKTLTPLTVAAITSFINPTISALAFFNGSHMREWLDTSRIEISTRRNLEHLYHITSKLTPPS